MWVSTKICASHALTGHRCSDFGGLYESAVCEVAMMSEELVGQWIESGGIAWGFGIASRRVEIDVLANSKTGI